LILSRLASSSILRKSLAEVENGYAKGVNGPATILEAGHSGRGMVSEAQKVSVYRLEEAAQRSVKTKNGT